MMTCNSPPAECFDVGSCMNGVGCVYPVRGGTCDAGTGTCLADGGCGYSSTSLFPYTPSNFDPALTIGADAGVSLNCNATIDTTAANHFPQWCNVVPTAQTVTMPDGGGNALLVIASSFAVNGNTLRVTGDVPLIIAVTGDATLNGDILVANIDGGVPPGGSHNAPGAAAWCTTGAGGTGHSGTNTSGGGGGGSLGTAGTVGGDGNNGTNMNGGAAGMTSQPTLSPLTGGCPGGKGGDGATNGGFGGGVLQISVAGTLSINGGKIGAPGLQGHGGDRNAVNACGGGGGGSGGALLFEAYAFATNGNPLLSTNGGGGGEGATTFGGNGSSDNAEPGHTNDTNRAAGGNGGSPNGGDGSSGATVANTAIAAQNGQGNNGCGGGGSGGLGLIRVNHYGGTCSAAAGTFSPAIKFNTPCP